MDFHKSKLTVLIAFGLVLILKLVIASQDMFLHDWDERFHALVAKNMMEYPFKPMLRAQPVLPYSYEAWCCNHIWIHKPPLSLWLIAGSLKIFGITALAVRIPGIIISTLLILIIYKIGRNLISKNVGTIAAILSGISYYHIELSVGALRVDHVDTILIFFTSVAMLCCIKMLKSIDVKWVWIAGIASACAILTKWLIGLFPLMIFFLTILSIKELRSSRIHWQAGIGSTVIALVTSAPWFIFIALRFPEEAAHEWLYNIKHLTQEVEESGGNALTYLANFHWQYGILSWIFMMLGLYGLRKGSIKREYQNFMMIGIILIYGFFSVVAKTKMPSYVLISTPLILIIMAIGIDKLISLFRNQYLQMILWVFIVYSFLAPHNILRVHFQRKDTHLIDATLYSRKEHNTEIYKDLERHQLPKGTAIFNTPPFEDVEAMFWSGHTCYAWWPESDVVDSLMAEGYHLAAFNDHGNQKLPDYMRANDNITIIDAQLK